MDEKGGNMMCKLYGRMEKRGHYDVQIKRIDGKGGIMMCKLNEPMDKGGHYDVKIKRADE